MSTNRTKQIARALADAIGSMMETAAEQLDMDARLAKIEIRMETFAAGLEVIGAQKDAIQKRMASLPKPMQALYQTQLHMLTLQEVEILEKAGAPPEKAVELLEHQPAGTVTVSEHRRRKPSRNGVSLENGTPIEN